MFCLVASSSVRDSRATFLRERKRRETTWARYSLEKHAPSAAELGQPTAHLSRYFRTITSQSAIFTSRRPVFSLSLYLPLFILLRHKTGQTEQRSNLPKQHSSMCRWPTKGSQTAGERKRALGSNDLCITISTSIRVVEASRSILVEEHNWYQI